MHEEADGEGDVEAALGLHFAGFHGGIGGKVGVWSRDRKSPGAGRERW